MQTLRARDCVCIEPQSIESAAGPGRRLGTKRRSRTTGQSAGFTLIEVLVALAVVAASLAAIGSLMAVSMQGTGTIERRLAFRETLRAIITSLPDRRDLNAGSATGELSGYRWRVDISPFVSTLVDPREPTPWEPEAVVIRVQAPSGQLLQINTIRLRRRPG
jgi:general secretion pathway protein I